LAETALRKCSCHCGKVEFEAELPETLRGSRCNCSICAAKGAVMVYLPLDKLKVTKGEDVLACYQFNTMVAKHHFCSHCGIHCFHQARSNPEFYAINAVCIEGVRPYEDFPEVAVYDGVHHSKDHGGVRRQSGTLRFEPSPDCDWTEDHG
jgi:hypothetical protein